MDPKSTPHVEPARTASRRERGLVMILVMAGLLLVLITGLSYMEVARQDRMATSNMARGNDIDIIAQAVIDLAAAKIKDDLGYDPAAASNAVPFAVDTDADGQIEEMYDSPAVDKWLASSAPEGGNLKTSLLSASYVGGSTTRSVAIADASGTTYLAANQPADADGDVIADANPEVAPIASLRGRDYYYWVRIIDNSSMVNINTSTSSVSALNTFSGDPPFNSSPADVNFGNLVFAHGGAAGELNAQLASRGLAGGPVIPLANRIAFWNNGGRFYDSAPYSTLGIDSEIDLRVRNGLNPLELESVLETQMRVFTRQNATATETSFSKLPAGMNTPATFYTNEPRHKLTTRSGFKQYAPRIAETAALMKLDLNTMITAANGAGISAEIMKVYGVGTPALPTGVTTAQEFSDQLAANIIDYADTNNRLTVVNGRYGLEALPFISEVHAQVAYRITAAAEPTAGLWDVTWTRQDPSGFVVEIRNPFRKPVKLADVSLVIGGTAVALSSLATTPALAVAGELGPDEVLFVYQNSGGGAAGDTIMTATGAPASGAGVYHATATATAFDNGGGGAPVNVEMRGLDTGGAPIVYQRVAVQAIDAQTSYAQTGYPSGADPTNTVAYKQRATIGNGDKINILTVTSTEFATAVNYTGTEMPEAYNAGLDALGATDKTAAGGLANKATPLANQFVFSDAGRINHLGELAHIAVIGPTAATTVADAWGASTTAASFMIDPASAVVMGTGEAAVPHAVMLMERLSVLNPGNGNIVPGSLNLNTVPAEVLASAMPIADSAARATVIAGIVAYRDGTGRPAGHRTGAGFAYIGEAYNVAQPFGGDTTDNRLVGAALADFISNPAADNSVADGIVDDREEQTLALRWLTGVGTTRSDVFTAYVLVRGYPAGTTATPDIERRVMIIFDRSKVAKAGDSIEILGTYTY